MTGELQPIPWELDNTPAPWDSMPAGEAEQLKRVYMMHKHYILAASRIAPVTSIFNKPMDNNLEVDELVRFVTSIYEESHYAFKINLSFGIILQNIETKEFRFFKPYRNTEIFDSPITISTRKDLEKLRARLNELDLLAYLLRQRPNTKFKPVMVTNAQLWVYSSKFVLGHEPMKLPTYLTKSKHVMTFEKRNDKHYNSKLYKDNLCAFRCLAYHLKPLLFESNNSEFEVLVKKLFQKWCLFFRKETGKDAIEGKFQKFQSPFIFNS